MRFAWAYVAVSWVPIALLAVLLWWPTGGDGYNAWAMAASLGPIVVGSSAALWGIGLLIWIAGRLRGRSSTGVLVASLIAGFPCAWFMARIWLRGLG